ncbi:hypothetical protein PZA11_002276 [Diplocarpon coronariae]|nr:hypothetical protein JHW43_006473 [Diplocarpon mali]
MPTHTYTSAYPPGIQVEAGIKTFFEEFYRTSDTPDAHDRYADFFAPQATLMLANKKGVGREEILAVRRGAWAAVSSRLHTPVKIFPFGEGADEVMLFGTVKYVLKDGRESEVDWAARANLVKIDGQWKLKFYQVYLDTAALQNAK